METCANYCDRSAMYFSSDEGKWIRRMLLLKEQHPDQIEIIAYPETNDGCIYCKMPVEWLKIQPKRTVILTDEQKAAAAARLKSIRKTNTED